MKRILVLATTLAVLLMAPSAWAQAVAPGAQKSAQQPEAKPEAKSEMPRSNLPMEPAEWAPPEALFYLGITDVGETWAALKETAAYRLLTDQQLAGAAPELRVVGKFVEGFKKRLAELLSVQPEQLKNPLAGPLCLYVVAPPGGKPDETELGLVAGVGDPELLKKYYDKVVAKLKDQGTHRAVSVDPWTIDVFQLPQKTEGSEEDQTAAEEDDEGEAGGLTIGPSPEKMIEDALNEIFSPDSLPERLAMCLAKDRLIVAGSDDQVKAILRREKGTRSLADTDDHKALLRHLRPTGTIRLLLNLPRLIALAKSGKAEGEAEELRKVLQVIGAESLGSVVGHCKLGAASYDSKFEVLFLMSGQRTGLAKLLSIDNRPSTPPASVPADTCIYFGLNANVPQILDQVEQMVRQTDPQEADQFQAAMEIELPDGGKVNLRKDFLDHLQGPLTLTFGFSKPLQLDSVRVLLGIGQRNQNAVVRFLSNPAVTQLPLTPRELRGAQVFDVPPIPPFLPGGLALAATTDRLVIGNLPAVEGALAAVSAEPLGETEGWKRVARFVPEQSWLTLYVDNYKLTSTLIDLAKRRDELMAGAGAMDMSALIVMGMLEGMKQGGGDVAQMEKTLKYTSQAVYTIATTPEGVHVTAVQLKPKE